MPRKKILSNKSQIVDVALALIDSEGLEAVSMRRLSKEMNVSSKTLYNYVLNVDEVLREILIRSFTGLYEQVYYRMEKLVSEGVDASIAYAKAYAMTLFAFAQSNKDICAYMLGSGYEAYHGDAELRHLYDPFGDILLVLAGDNNLPRLKSICQLYEGAIISQIRNHISGVKVCTEDEFENTVDLLIELMFNTKV